MQVNNGEAANHSFGTIDLPTESTSPMDLEQDHGCHSCAGNGTGPSKKTESRPTYRSRAASGDGDRTSVKLRNSCRSCADSKVRCDREKPRCSRCDARDLSCEYLQSKRPGRVPGASSRQKQAKQAVERSSQGNDSIAQAINTYVDDSGDASLVPVPFRLEDFTLDFSQQHAQRETSVCSTSSTSHINGNTVASSPGADTEPGGSYACNAPVAPMATVTPFSNKDHNTCIDDIMDMVVTDPFWPMEDDCGNLFDIDFTDFANVPASPHASHSTALTTSTHASSAVFSSSSSSSTVHLQDMFGMTAPSPGTSQSSIVGPSSKSNSPSCTCMIRALEILKTLSSDDPPDTSSTAGEHYTQRILLNNKEDIDASLAMLACRACSSDRFLLMVLLMNAAKILTRYASAAALCRSCAFSNMPSTPGPIEQTSLMSDHTNQLMEIPRAWGGVCVMPPAPKGTCENQRSCREAVQRVLRELHRLQRLLAHLALRRESLRGEGESRAIAAGLTDTLAGSLMMRDRSGSRTGPRSAASPFGAASAVLIPRLHDNALGLVEGDVRNGLGVLSAVIRDLLNNS